MSLKTWKQEFYPTRASEFCDLDPHNLQVQKSATEHSLKKWIGLRKENLSKHDVRYHLGDITDDGDDELPISGDTCSLCRLAYDRSDNYMSDKCQLCPIVSTLHELPCTRYVAGVSKYSVWSSHGNPEPMIELLEGTLAAVNKAIEESNVEHQPVDQAVSLVREHDVLQQVVQPTDPQG